MNHAVSLGLIALSVALIGVVTSIVILRTRHIHLKHTGDSPVGGPQKLHTESTPRIGGVSIWVAMCCAWLLSAVFGAPLPARTEYAAFFGVVLLLASPMFLLGLCEDILQMVSVRLRLVFSLVIAAIFVLVVDVRITRLSIPVVDVWLVSLPILSVCVTAFAIAGLIHAMNIVDGLNGLLSGIASMALLAIAFVANSLGDPVIFQVAVLMVASIVGFAVFNFPGGKIFAGDGGAYLIGFVLAVLVVALTHRHATVSPWFAMAVLIHPVWETVFSALRRFVAGQSATEPDASHLHSLVSRHLKILGKTRGYRVILGSNSGAAVRCALLACLPMGLATLNPFSDIYLMLTVVVYVALYVVIFLYYLRAVDKAASSDLMLDSGW